MSILCEHSDLHYSHYDPYIIRWNFRITKLNTASEARRTVKWNEEERNNKLGECVDKLQRNSHTEKKNQKRVNDKRTSLSICCERAHTPHQYMCSECNMISEQNGIKQVISACIVQHTCEIKYFLCVSRSTTNMRDSLWAIGTSTEDKMWHDCKLCRRCPSRFVKS